MSAARWILGLFPIALYIHISWAVVVVQHPRLDTLPLRYLLIRLNRISRGIEGEKH